MLEKGRGRNSDLALNERKKLASSPVLNITPPHLNYCPLETSFLPPFSLSLPPLFSSFADSPKRGERRKKFARKGGKGK